MTTILKKITALILTINIAIFGYFAWPTSYSTVGIANSGLPVVARAAQEASVSGSVYRLDRDAIPIQAIIRLDLQFYEQSAGHVVIVHPGWRAYVVTGDLAQELTAKFHKFAFTDPINRVIIFFAVHGVDPMVTIAHEYTHVIQAEDNMRLFALPRIVAEYEAEVISRSTVGLLFGLSLPTTYPVHSTSTIENLQVRKYLAS